MLCVPAVGQADGEVMVRHHDAVGKIQRPFFILKLLQLWMFSQALVCHSRDRVSVVPVQLFGNKGNWGCTLTSPRGAGGVSLVEMEAPGVPFHPSTAMHQAAQGIRSFICSLGETEITKKICGEGT